jgi:hypothetical protein
MYVDETGTDDPPIYGMAGYLARAEQWAAFNDEWQAVLDEPPTIKAFHMKEARYLGYDTKLPKLTAIIKKHVIAAFAVGVLHQDFEDVVKGKVSRIYDTPYAMLYGSVITYVSHYMRQHYPDEKVDFIFDEKGKESDRLQESHNKIVELAPQLIKKNIENRPIHISDDLVPPLQAADVLCWVYRRIAHLAVQNKPINPELSQILGLVPLNSTGHNRTYLEKMVKHLTTIGRENGKYAEHDFVWLVENQDFIINDRNNKAFAAARAGSTIELISFDAKQMKRFLLVHSCPSSGIPHLHRKAGGACLG